MSEHQHDEFDDVPADSAHRGAYRAAPAEGKESARATIMMIVAGMLALILGGIMFVIAPRSAAPGADGGSGTTRSSAASESVTSSDGASASDDASTTDEAGAASSASATASPDAATTVEVFNASGTQGAAEQAAGTLRTSGWTVSRTANWDGVQQVDRSTVYYRSGAEDQARAVAATLGIDTVEESADHDADVVVVVAA